MNLFKPQKSTPPPPPQMQPHNPLQQAFTTVQTHFSNFIHNLNQPPQHHPLHQAFSSLQTHLSNFIHNSSHQPPAFAKIPHERNPSTAVLVENNAWSVELFEQRLAGVPVYALANGSREYVLISGTDSTKNLGLFCFSEADADSLLKQMRALDPSTGSDSHIVAVALSKVVQLKVDGVALRLIPEASQVQNALKERERIGIQGGSFPGVPVFQSKSLVLSSQNKRYRPVFFRKEDLEESLSRASRDQNELNPMVRGDIQVAVLEDIIKGMKDTSTSTWDDVVFIPPGFDVTTDRSKQSR